MLHRKIRLNDWSFKNQFLTLTNRSIKNLKVSPRTSEQIEAVKKEKRMIIENAALEIFAEDGYHHASVSKIAKRAGVSKGLMYNYFHSKEELLKELIRDIIKGVSEELALPFDKDLTDEDLVNFVKVSLNLVKEDPQRWKLFSGMFLQKQVMELMMSEMMEVSAQYVAPFLRYFKAKGIDQPEAWLRYFHATIDGVQLQIMMDSKNFPSKKVEEMIIKQFIK